MVGVGGRGGWLGRGKGGWWEGWVVGRVGNRREQAARGRLNLSLKHSQPCCIINM